MIKPKYDSASIIIPTYNRSELLKRTLNSINISKLPIDTQIIVADDGSSEPIKTILNKYNDILEIDYYHQDDCGFRAAKARNCALKLARNPILIFLDCGMHVCENFVQSHIKVHQASKRPSYVAGYNYGFDRDNENSSTIEELISSSSPPDIFSKLDAYGGLLDPRNTLFELCNYKISQLPAPWTLMWTCNVSIEKDVFEIVGGFNENFVSWGGEDTELAYRLSRCGIEFELAKSAKALHLPHAKDGKNLQKQSMENFAGQTTQYSDPIINKMIELGDVAVNLKLTREY